MVKRLSAPATTISIWAFCLSLFVLPDTAHAADLIAVRFSASPAVLIALALAIGAIIYLLFNQHRQDKALGQLAELSEKLCLGQELGQELSWRKTGAIEIDLIAATLTRIDDRLKHFLFLSFNSRVSVSFFKPYSLINTLESVPESVRLPVYKVIS